MNTKNSQKEKNNFNSISTQELLSVGYLLLIMVGIYLEYLRLIPFEINILEHSDFADFLISPLKDPIMIILPIIFSFLFILYAKFVERRKFRKKKFLTEENNSKDNELEKATKPPFDYKGLIIMVFAFFICLNIGFGIGQYSNLYEKTQKKLDANITNATVKFIGGESKEVYILSKNTSNLFYFENGNIELIVCPIPGNVKSIQYIPKDKQKQLEEK